MTDVYSKVSVMIDGETKDIPLKEVEKAHKVAREAYHQALNDYIMERNDDVAKELYKTVDSTREVYRLAKDEAIEAELASRRIKDEQ